jgi:CBS domain-containing protein
MTTRSTRRCSVYDGDGECCGQSLDLETPVERGSGRVPTIAKHIPLRQIMTPDVICARAELSVAGVVTLMIHHHIGCIPVVDDRRRPIGMITKFDIVEHLDAFMRSAVNGSPLPSDLAARSADELMMPLAMTLGENATVATAAALMAAEDLHHVLVINERGHLVGIVSTKDITNWLVENDAGLPSTR